MNRARRGAAPPPGPRGLPLLGSAPDFRRDPLETFTRAWREYGDLVSFRGPVPVVLVTHPDHLRHILVDNFANYPHPDDFNDKVSVSVGRGLVTTEGEEWERQRGTVAPSFRREPLERFAEVMVDSTERMLDGWERVARAGGEIDARTEMQSLTLDILARCLFRADWSVDARALGEAVRVQLEHLNGKLTAVVDLPEWVPTRRNRQFTAARTLLDETVYRLIAERRRGSGPPDTPDGDGPPDLLSMLMRATDPVTGASMTDRQLRDQVMTLFVAGHETAAATLSWICYLMSVQPAETERARAEVREVLGGRPPTKDDLPRLKYLKMFVQEALRLYPPLWQVPRMPLRDDEIGGHHIPAGTFLLLGIHLTHRHPDFWENPEGFDPERFTRERSAGRPRCAYLPYAAGPRDCAGMAFATMELTLVTASLLQRFHLDLVPGHPIVTQPDITLRAKYGIPMTLRRTDSGTDLAAHPGTGLATDLGTDTERHTPAGRQAAAADPQSEAVCPVRATAHPHHPHQGGTATR